MWGVRGGIPYVFSLSVVVGFIFLLHCKIISVELVEMMNFIQLSLCWYVGCAWI